MRHPGGGADQAPSDRRSTELSVRIEKNRARRERKEEKSEAKKSRLPVAVGRQPGIGMQEVAQ